MGVLWVRRFHCTAEDDSWYSNGFWGKPHYAIASRTGKSGQYEIRICSTASNEPLCESTHSSLKDCLAWGSVVLTALAANVDPIGCTDH